MSKYIDADKFWKRLISVSENDWVGFDTIDEILSEMPATDVAEVKHGRWEYVKKRLARGGYVDASECSVCHKIIMPHLKPNYCPNCGTKMEEHFEEPEINPCRGCEDYDGKGGCISNGGCGAKMVNEDG